MEKKPKILVIVGPTASGKTSLSIQLAQKYNGEVVSADSRQVYRGLDIGTGKVTEKEMSGIPHHMLDIADPHTTYTAHDYVRDGRRVITDILSRNKLPVIVGGTFLYVDALLGKISTSEVPPNKELRTHLETLQEKELFTLLKEKDPVYAMRIDAGNKRRLIRALEIIDALGTVPEAHNEELYTSLTLGIAISKEQLKENVHSRLVSRLDSGMIDEVKHLQSEGLSYERLSELGIEYQSISEYLQGKVLHEEMCTQIETKSWQYAKRQMTWLKRDQNIHWIDPNDKRGLEKHLEEFLS